MRWLVLFILFTGCSISGSLSVKPLKEQPRRSIDQSPHKRMSKPKTSTVPTPPDPRLHDVAEVIKKNKQNAR